MSQFNIRQLVYFIALIVLMATASLPAQTTRGAIVGTVKDETGGVIPGVQVTVRNLGTSLERTTLTADNGTFRVPGLSNGLYQLSAEIQGFKKAVVKDVTVGVDQTVTVDVVMQVGTASESVDVVGSVSLVQKETNQLGEVINNQKVVGLPLNGRDFTQLARLVPGVATAGGGGGQQGGEGGATGYSSNGQRSSSNNFMVDGIDNNNFFAGSVSQLPSIDSIQEFAVQTNTYAAEYGRNSGSVINLVTKTGTNEFHGDVFEFLRNDAMDARNFFDNPQFRKPTLRLNQFGGTLGGPIVKDKTFFFGSYEGFRQRAEITKLTNVPTLDQRQGIFTDADGNTVQVPLNPSSAELFGLFPQPNLTGRSGNFVSSPKLTRDRDQFMIKIDQTMPNNGQLALRYSFGRHDTFFPFTPGQGGATIPGFGLDSTSHDQLFSIGYTSIFSPRALNEARFGFNRSTNLNVTEEGAKAVDFGINTGHPADDELNLGKLPSITFSGGLVSGAGRISNLGGSINQPNRTNQNTFQFIDNFSFTTARHALKFGADIRRIQVNRRFDLAQSGQIVFSGSQNGEGIADPLVDFAEGLPSSSLQFVGDSNRGLRTTAFGFFFQDSWKLRSNFTLNYGIRYELNTVIHGVTGRLSTWRPSQFQHFLSPAADQTDLQTLNESGVVTQDQVDGIYDGDHNNFAPRIGFAYSVGADGKTVIRGGYGVFYDTILGNVPGNIQLNPPFLPGFFNPAPFVSFPDSFGPAAFPVLTITDQNFATPYAQQFNLTVQRELPGQMALEVAYVGSTGTHLPRFRQINQAFLTQGEIDQLVPSVEERMLLMGIPQPAVDFLKNHIDLIPPIARNQYFGFAQIFQAETSVSSHYHSLQTKLDKKLSDHLSFLLSYTYSKSIDSASVFFGSGANGTTIFPQNNFNPGEGERGRSDFDVRNRLSFSYLYEFPSLKGASSGLASALANGWRMSGILTLQSGQPFSVLTGSDNSRTGLGNDRPDLVGDPNAGPHTVEQFFNTAAFVPNQVLHFGNSGRNIVTGPDFKVFDLAVMKDTQLNEEVNIQFRAEFFNFTNHPNFGIPNNVLGSPNFGALFQTADTAQNSVGLGSGGPRLIQFGLKVIF